MQGFKHLVSAKKPATSAGQDDIARNTGASPGASHVPAVDIMSGDQPAPQSAPEMERRSGMNTRISNPLSREAGDLSAAQGHPPETTADVRAQAVAQAVAHSRSPAPGSAAGYVPPGHHEPSLDPRFVEPRHAPVQTPSMDHPPQHAPMPPMERPAPSPLAREAMMMEPSEVAPRPPAASRRQNTRLLGFSSEDAAPDPFAGQAAPVAAAQPRYPIGWLVVLDGPGEGMCFTVTAGLTTIGRAADQTISLDFGDDSISREQHVAIAYDEDENTTYVGHGGKRNIVRLNDKPLLSTEALTDGDQIKVGKTLLLYVGLCTGEFAWRDASGRVRGDG